MGYPACKGAERVLPLDDVSPGTNATNPASLGSTDYRKNSRQRGSPASPTPLLVGLYNQIPYEQTKAINQWRSIGKSPFSDECLVQLTSDERYDDSGNLLIADETRGVYLDCTYEEDISMASAQRRYRLEANALD